MEQKENRMPAEQWKHQGFCSFCRRRTYCKTRCAAHRRNVVAAAENFFMSMTGGNLIREAVKAAGGEMK